MVLTSSRILSCEVWLILMRKTSAPASNRRRIIALSEDAGPSVARILMRRRRLMACFRARRLAADQTRPEASRPADPRCPEGFRGGRGQGVVAETKVRRCRIAPQAHHGKRRHRHETGGHANGEKVGANRISQDHFREAISTH